MWPVLEAIQELMSVYMEDLAEDIEKERGQLAKLGDPENIREWMEDCVTWRAGGLSWWLPWERAPRARSTCRVRWDGSCHRRQSRG